MENTATTFAIAQCIYKKAWIDHIFEQILQEKNKENHLVITRGAEMQ